MKSLVESILSSTNAGKFGKVSEWCEKYLAEGTWQVDADGRVSNHSKYNTIIEQWMGQVPEYVKFGTIDHGFFAGDLSQFVSIDQLPTACEVFYLDGAVKELDDFTTPIIHQLNFNVHEQYFFKIKKALHVMIDPKISFLAHKYTQVDFSETGLDFESFKNVFIHGFCTYIELTKTPAGEKIWKMIRKEKDKTGDIQEICNKLFVNIPDTRFVKVTPRITLEHNPISHEWSIF